MTFFSFGFYRNCQIVIDMNAKPAGKTIAYIHAITFTTGVQIL